MSTGPTPLQARLAGQILAHLRLAGLKPGHHLTEGSLLPVLGTSRSPVRKAMEWLATRGVLAKRPNRGFFLAAEPDDFPPNAATETAPDDGAYTALALDRVAGHLPDSVSENELIRRYGLSRAQLRLVLARVAAEGWIERRPGRGWAFRALIDSPRAYREIYRLRLMIEPAALREPDWRIDAPAIARLRARQKSVLKDGFRTLTQIDLFSINAVFHETLAAMSGNRFVLQTLERMNHLRRLIEYGRPLDRARVRRVCAEHLAILDALEAGSTELAAGRMAAHLAGASDEKAGNGGAPAA